MIEYTKNSFVIFKVDLLLLSKVSFFCIPGLWQNEIRKVMKIWDLGHMARSQLATLKPGCQRSQPTSSADGVGKCKYLRFVYHSFFTDLWPQLARLCSDVAGQGLRLQDLATFTLTYQPPESICQELSVLWHILFREDKKHRFWIRSQQQIQCKSWLLLFCNALSGK